MDDCPGHDKVALSAKEQAAFDTIVRATTFDQDQRALSAAIADIRFNPSLHVIDGFQRSARRMWRYCA